MATPIIPNAHEAVIRILTRTVPMPNAFVVTFRITPGEGEWRAQADNGQMGRRSS